MPRALFISHYSSLYGANRSLLDLLDGMQLLKIEPFVIIPGPGGIQEEFLRREIPCQIIPMARWVTEKTPDLHVMIRSTIDVRYSIKCIEKLIDNWNFNFIYTNSSITPIGRIIALKKKIPHVWHLREFGKLHYGINFVYPEALTRRFIRNSDAVICNSEALKNYYFEDNKKNIHVVYNGIASKKQFDYFYIDKRIRSSDRYVFSMVGRLSSSKGQDVAIKALAEIKRTDHQAKLVIVGDGEEEYVNYCKALVKNLGLCNDVEFMGYLKNPYEVYNISDCLLMCSQYEAMGRVTVEAMSACLPVIGRNSGGTPEIIVNGQTGILYDSFSQLVDAMKDMVNDPARGREMGIEGWKVARERFNTEQYVDKIYQILQSL